MTPTDDRLDPVDRLAGEFLERVRAGERPAIEDYAQRHPEVAERIRAVFAALLLIENHGADAFSRGWSPVQRVPLANPHELADYRLLREIGRGGMGVVYEAEQLSLGRRVALKLLPFHSILSPEHIRRFQLEARTAARLEHPGIVPVHDVGRVDGVHYYAMQFIAGEGLDRVIAEIRSLRTASAVPGDVVPEAGSMPGRSLAAGLLGGSILPLELTTGAQAGPGPKPPRGEGSGSEERPSGASSASCRLAPGEGNGSSSRDARYFRTIALLGIHVADALGHAHAAGVVHRDVKPSNLLLDAQGKVWVTDFGLAKTDGCETLTHSGDFVGTLRYMSPERFQGWSDPRSDVYGLGVTLYELLTLRPAFTSVDRAALVGEILHQQPPRPRALEPRIPRDLETIILKAIEKEPADRYPTATSLAADLKRFLASRPILARRTSARERARLWCRRNPLGASLIATVGALVVAAGVTASAVAVRLGRLASDLQREQQSTLANLRRASREEARARRASRTLGRRHASLEALAQAAQIDPGTDLRSEAAAALSLLDLRSDRSWGFGDSRLSAFDIDPAFVRYAYGDQQGAIHVCRVSDRVEVERLPPPRAPCWRIGFSPDGANLVAVHGVDATLWNLDSGRSTVYPGSFFTARFAFSVDGRLLALGGTDGVLRIVETASGRIRQQLELGEQPRGMSFHPDSRRLAVSTWRRAVEIWDVPEGALLEKVEVDDIPFAIAWDPAGNYLAAGGSRRSQVYVWNTGSWRRPLYVLDGHRSAVEKLEWSPDGELLASFSYDQETVVWQTALGEKLLGYEGELVGFSGDGRWLGFRFMNTAETFEVTRSETYRTLAGAKVPVPLDSELEFSPDGRWLASAHTSGVRIWEPVSGACIAQIDVAACSAAFLSTRELVTAGARGVQVWPLSKDPTGNRTALEVGPPRAVPSPRNLIRARLQRDRRTLLLLEGPISKGARPHLLDLANPAALRSFGPYPRVNVVDASSDLGWIAGGTWHGTGVPIWSTDREKPVEVLPAPYSAFVRFSPEGKWLVVSDGPQFRFLTVGTWKEEWSVPRRRVSDPPGWIEISGDGRFAAVPVTLKTIRLIDLAERTEILTLDPPYASSVGAIRFSPDATVLVAATQNDFAHVWDLRRLRRELRPLGLDWDSGEEPRADADAGEAGAVALPRGRSPR